MNDDVRGLAKGGVQPEISLVRTRLAALWLATALAAGSASLAQAQDPALSTAVRDFGTGFTLDFADARVGDFDGDGRDDVAGILHGPGKRALVVFHGSNGGYVAHPLYAPLPDGEVELRLVPPGNRRVLGPPGVVELSSPALELVFPGRSSALYAWRGGRYHTFGTESH